MVLPSVTSHNDLVTAREATCQGFLELAKAKTEKASLYIDEAMEYWEELKQTAAISEVPDNPRLREGLISTAGVSAKAHSYLSDADIKRILSGILEGIPEDRKEAFREELFYRYLLTKGATQSLSKKWEIRAATVRERGRAPRRTAPLFRSRL
jgi:hypothetical protein